SPSPASRQANGNRSEPATPSSGCMRSSSDGSRHKPCCPARRPRPCCSGPCSPPGRSPCERSMDGRPCRTARPIKPLTSPPDRIASSRPKTRRPISTQFETAPRQARHQAVVIDSVEKLFEIEIDHDAVALGDITLRLSHCLMGGAPRSKAVAVLGKRRVPPLLENLQHSLLNQPV